MPCVCRILALRLADATRFLSLAGNEHWPNGHSCLPPSAFGHWVSAPLHDSSLEEGHRPRKVHSMNKSLVHQQCGAHPAAYATSSVHAKGGSLARLVEL